MNIREKAAEKDLSLAVDMYGCPNRCRHCWLGHMPNRKMEDGVDEWIVDCFQPYFKRISFYSWLREPDFCDDYRERWRKDIALSVQAVPERYELASFWRIVRDPEYVPFLKEVGGKDCSTYVFRAGRDDGPVCGENRSLSGAGAGNRAVNCKRNRSPVAGVPL